MKRKKINFGVISSALSRSEMREIMAGSSSGGGGGGGTSECNCLICYLSNGGVEEYASICSQYANPTYGCIFLTGDIFATGNYGICY